MSEDSQESGGEVYEIDRIIGRRVSIGKTEYLVFWKGYTISDCTWEPLVISPSCEQAISDFEARCTNLRFEHARNPRTRQIDMYENEGIATLLEEALELFADGSPVFQNEVSDFDFAAGGANSAATSTPTLSGKKKRTSRPKPVVATVGWNRKIRYTDTTRALIAVRGSSQVSGIQRPVISAIVGAMKLSSGYRCYLTQWSDGELSWERPAAFDEAMDVLHRYEDSRDASDRNSLLMQFRQANKAGTLGPVLTSAKKTNLERMTGHSSLGSNSWISGSASVPRSVSDSPASQLPPMFDLSTSSLLKVKPAIGASTASASPNLSKDGDAFAAPTLPAPSPQLASSLPNRGKPHSKLVVAESSDEDVEVEDEVILPTQIAVQKPESNAQAPTDAPRLANTAQRSVYVDIDLSIASSIRASLPRKSTARLEAERQVGMSIIARLMASSVSNSTEGYFGFKRLIRGRKASSSSSVETMRDRVSSRRARQRVRDRENRFTSMRRNRAYLSGSDGDDTDSYDEDADSSENELMSGRTGSSRAKQTARLARISLLSDARSRVAPRASTSTASTASSDNDIARVSNYKVYSTPTNRSKCDFCLQEIAEGTDRVLCGECKMAYHGECFVTVVRRVGISQGVDEAIAQSLAQSPCVLCSKYRGADIESVLTCREDPKSTRVLGGVIRPPEFDVYVKWKGRSYRHASWVPFIWMSKFKSPQVVAMLKMRFRDRVQPAVKDSFDQLYLLPDTVIGAARSSLSMKSQRESEIRLANATVADADMYTHYEKLRIAWTKLDLDQATWEPVPSPIVDPEWYKRLYPLFKVWEMSEKVSLNKHRKLAPVASSSTGFSPFKKQPEYLQAGKMYEYQIEGLNWLLYQRNRKMAAILADDPGLGKTIQTVAFLSAIYYSTVPDGLRNSDAASSNLGTFPFLVVVPTSLVDNWIGEFKKWAPFLTVTTLSGRDANRKIQFMSTIFREDSSGNLDLRCHVLLTSYEAFCRPEAQLQFRKAGITWEALVFDEGHRLKNDQSITYKTLDKIKARQRIILTGTPLQNNIEELFSLLSFAIPDERNSLNQLKAQFEADSRIVDQVRSKIRPYMLRRSKKDVQLMIPPKYEVNLPVSLSKLQSDLYSGVLEKNAHTLQRIARALHRHSGQTNGSRPASVGSTQNILMELRRIISHPYLIKGVELPFEDKQEEQRQLVNLCGKLQLLDVLIPELRARGHRILLFGQFKESLTILEDYFAYAGIKYVRMDGDTPQQQRQSIVNDFNAPDSDILVFMATTRTAGHGLNLTSADVVIIYDSDFNPHYDMQAMARAHRIGQTKPVLVFKLVVENSVEQRILEASTRKLALDYLIIQSMDKVNEEADPANEPKESVIMQALRSEAKSLINRKTDSSASANADTDTRVIKYDRAKITKLLDDCMVQVKAQAEIDRSARLSGERPTSLDAFSFARVWEVSPDGQLVDAADKNSETGSSGDDPDADDDVWSRLVAISDAQEKAAAEAAAAAADDILADGDSRLRVRKNKVNYALFDDADNAGAAKPKKRGQSKSNGSGDDDNFVAMEESDSEDETMLSHTASAQPANEQPVNPPQRLYQPTFVPPQTQNVLPGAVMVLPDDLGAIAHRTLIQVLRDFEQAKAHPNFRKASPDIDEKVRIMISDLQRLARNPEALSREGMRPPKLLFKVPINLCLPNGMTPPPQPFDTPCFVCGQEHGSWYCKMICYQPFVSTVLGFWQREPNYWQSTLYHHFIYWYSIQILWFVTRQSHVAIGSVYNDSSVCFLDASVVIAEIQAQRQQAQFQSQSRLQSQRHSHQQQQQHLPSSRLHTPHTEQTGMSAPPVPQPGLAMESIYSADSPVNEPSRQYFSVLGPEEALPAALAFMRKMKIPHVDPTDKTNPATLKKYLAVYDTARATILNDRLPNMNNSAGRHYIAFSLQYFAVLMQHTAARIAQLEGGAVTSGEPASQAIDVATPTLATPQASTPDSLATTATSAADTGEKEAMDVDIAEDVRSSDPFKHGIDDIALVRSLISASLAQGIERTTSQADMSQKQELLVLLESLYGRLFQAAAHSVQGANNAEIVVNQLVEAVLANESAAIEKLLSSIMPVPGKGSDVSVGSGQPQTTGAHLQVPPAATVKEGPADTLISPPITAHTRETAQINVPAVAAPMPPSTTPSAHGYNSLGVLLTPLSTDRPNPGSQGPVTPNAATANPQVASIQRLNTSVPVSRPPVLPQSRPHPPRPVNASVIAAASRPSPRPPVPAVAAPTPSHRPRYNEHLSGSVTAGVTMSGSPVNIRPRPSADNMMPSHSAARPPLPLVPHNIRRQSAPVDTVPPPINAMSQPSQPASRRNSGQYAVSRITSSQSPVIALSEPTTSVAIVPRQTSSFGLVHPTNVQSASGTLMTRPEHLYVTWSKAIDKKTIDALRNLMEWGYNEARAKNMTLREEVAKTAIMLFNLIVSTLDNFEPPAGVSDTNGFNGVASAYWALRANISNMFPTVSQEVIVFVYYSTLLIPAPECQTRYDAFRDALESYLGPGVAARRQVFSNQLVGQHDVATVQNGLRQHYQQMQVHLYRFQQQQHLQQQQQYQQQHYQQQQQQQRHQQQQQQQQVRAQPYAQSHVVQQPQNPQIRSGSNSLVSTASPSPMLSIRPDRPASSDDDCMICFASDHQMLECPHRMKSAVLNRRMTEVLADRDISESKRFMILSALRILSSTIPTVSGPH